LNLNEDTKRKKKKKRKKKRKKKANLFLPNRYSYHFLRFVWNSGREERGEERRVEDQFPLFDSRREKK
jgi:hypothetical protein